MASAVLASSVSAPAPPASTPQDRDALLASASLGPEAVFEWQASSGVLLSDDLQEVEWRAPARPGPCRLSVKLSMAGLARAGTLELDVLAPSTEGMLWIPPGVFLQGDLRGTRNLDEAKTLQNLSDEPFHSVFLDGYWIDRHQVTHDQYCQFLAAALEQGMVRVEPVAVMGKFEGAWVPFYYFQSFERLILNYRATRNARTPEFLHAISYEGARFQVKPGYEKSPAVDVSWFGAAAYARFHGKQLPTEAQWEKAARGSDGRRYSWGDHLPSPTLAAVDGYYTRGDVTTVGYFSPSGDSPYGAADMMSNCFEWTNDWFNPDYYPDYVTEAAPPLRPDYLYDGAFLNPAGRSLRNPGGPFWGKSHTIRGSPVELTFPQSSFDFSEPISFRYSWIFEFMLGDAFANRNTAFRTVISTHG